MAGIVVYTREVSYLNPCSLCLIFFSVEDYPDGWPRLAEFLNSNDSLAIFRRFGMLHCRPLLMLQAEITKLEKNLVDLDRFYDASGSTSYRSKSTRHEEGWDTEQIELCDQLRKKITIYCKYSL